jgi:hypothetical protein
MNEALALPDRLPQSLPVRQIHRNLDPFTDRVRLYTT